MRLGVVTVDVFPILILRWILLMIQVSQARRQAVNLNDAEHAHIGIPDAEARFHILTVLLSKTPHSISPDDLRSAAAKAHGYVGADLSAVVREAGTLAIKRWLASATTGAPSTPQTPSR